VELEMTGTMNAIVPVILAGGSGTRLWPLSRELYPKQLLSLGPAHSLFQETLLRVDGAAGAEGAAPLIVCNEEHRFHILDQAEAVGVAPRAIVLEPEGRNTAPALTAAALLLREADPVMVMMPADHAIEDRDAFRACLRSACEQARAGCIATLGVVPRRPETGYGYIRVRAGAGEAGALPVEGFVEKPDADTAAAYAASGEYLWNSGVYVLRAGVWLRAIGRFRPDILAACEAAVARGARDGDFFRLDAASFRGSPSESVDFAVMEPASADAGFECRVVPYGGGWSDVGSWQAVWEQGRRDENQNVLSGDVAAQDTHNSLLLSEGRFVAALGCDNLVIAETADAVLVADLRASQGLSAFVRHMKESGREEALIHRRVYRPWGSYESLVRGDNYQVKRLVVRAGRKLSLQLHQRRAEHWVVVRGTAAVIRGEEALTLRENESVFIPPGTKHRLGNEGEVPLEVIEVQTGDYLGEDDIVRFADDFGRS
jgi:mannose-1-phosphate guanylyltransferase/mannose-6-phosphate isomerase